MERENAEAGNNLRARFLQLYPVLKSELLQHPAFEHDSLSHQWVETMLDYNVPGGKLNRGLSVVETYLLLKCNGDRDQLLRVHDQHEDEEELFLACVLGWCIQWLVGCVLVLDDVLDGSYTRRGRPCWYRLPKVGMIAVNDGVLLWNHINLLLKKHFRGKPYYVDLVDLFNEVEFQTASGEILDLLTGDKDLSMFTPALQRRISKYKTAYGTFYLPFACALLLLGERVEQYDDVKDVLLEMGLYFQVQDDYLDCFGDPEMVGKIGSDIEDFKCSWLVVKALELCNEEQRKVLNDNYGKADPASVAAVKEVYNELDLKGIYAEYETEVYEKLMARIEAIPSKGVQAVLKVYLHKIYRRQK